MGSESSKHPSRFAVIGAGGLGGSLFDGLARLVDIAPTSFVVFSEDSDWGFMGRDIRDAMDTMIAADQRLQPSLPFEEEELVEAK